jgi:hypothetical protein
MRPTLVVTVSTVAISRIPQWRECAKSTGREPTAELEATSGNNAGGRHSPATTGERGQVLQPDWTPLYV